MKCFTNDKNEIRYALKAQRKLLSKSEIAEKSRIICDEIYKRISEYKSILCYISHMGEVDLTYLIKRLLDDGKIVSVPICTKDTSIIPSQIDALNFEYNENEYKIREPKIFKKPSVFPDCCIVPGVGFDENLNRVGHGKGYYDRFLSENSMMKIAPCYDFQIIKNIPSSPFDVKMNCIISEKRVI